MLARAGLPPRPPPMPPDPLPRAAPPTSAPRPLRLAVVETVAFGGLLHYAVQLADALADAGHDVDLVLPAGHELAGHPGAARRLDILPAGAGQPTSGAGRVAVLARRARTAAFRLRSWRRIIAAARAGRYDAVLLNGSFDLTLTVRAAHLLMRVCPGTAVAHVCHNVRPFNRWGGEELFVSDDRLTSALRGLYPAFDLVFVHGERSRREFDELWPGAQLAVIPHGDERVFGDQPPPPSPEPRALFFGDWRRVKGLDVLMSGFDAVSAALPAASLTIAGSPAPEEGGAGAVLAWAADRPGRVEVDPRYVPLEEVRALFGRARVVVLPYRVGYQSGVLHLAMTMGRAVVVTDVGDLAGVVEDGVTGLVVPAGDVDALTAAIVRVLADPELADRLGAAGRARLLAGSDWGTVAATAAPALQAAVERHGRR